MGRGGGDAREGENWRGDVMGRGIKGGDKRGGSLFKRGRGRWKGE